MINDAAQAYEGVIPDDRYKDPYMPAEELSREIEHGVRFWGLEQDGRLLGVMGLQDVEDVTLIRHAYVRTTHRRRGIGGRLLQDLRAKATRPLLVGTWAAARLGHRVLPPARLRAGPAGPGAVLLRRYWSVPERQIETSVVLAEKGWPNQAVSPSIHKSDATS